jgi:hypothetical protein
VRDADPGLDPVYATPRQVLVTRPISASIAWLRCGNTFAELRHLGRARLLPSFGCRAPGYRIRPFAREFHRLQRGPEFQGVL